MTPYCVIIKLKKKKVLVRTTYYSVNINVVHIILGRKESIISIKYYKTGRNIYS